MRRLLTGLTRAAGEGLFRLGLAPTLIESATHRLRVLLYHSVGPGAGHFLKGIGDPLPTREFERHLDHLVTHYTPVAVEDVLSGELPPRPMLITFDDGYRCLMTHAFEPLRDRGIRPIVFLVGNAVGNRSLVWTNEVAWALNTHGPAALSVIRSSCPELTVSSTSGVVQFLWTCLAPQALTDVLNALRHSLGYDPVELAAEAELYLTWDEICFLRENGWSFGNHTVNHYSLPTLPPEAQANEIAAALDILGSRLGEVQTFAYPFGDHDASSREAALRSGHKLLMQVGGVNRSPLDLTRIARVPGQGPRSPARLFAEMEVTAPLKAWLRSSLNRA